MIFEGKRIYLRRLIKRDATEKYASWINDPEVNKYLDSKKISIHELENYIWEKLHDPNCLFLGIFLKNNDEHIGNIKLDFNESKATLGILIGKKSLWDKGFGSEAIKLLISYAFEQRRLIEINLGVNKENHRAYKLYLKNGFRTYEETSPGYKMRLKKAF